MKPRLHVRRLLRDHPAPSPQPTPCRLWQGAVDRNGYSTRGNTYIHRWVWTQFHGPIPRGLCVLHRCDNPLCYRLDHLFLGTQAENMHDMKTKGRHRYPVLTGESHPSARLTEGAVLMIRERAARGERLRTIARDFAVHEGTVSDVVRRRTWQHVPVSRMEDHESEGTD